MERLQLGPPLRLTGALLPWILLGFMVESLLYGVHAILFFICVHILVRRRRKLQMVMLGAVVVMFILATADTGVSWNIVLRHTASLYTGDSTELAHMIYPKFLLYIVNNLIADVLLVLRCFVVWGRKMIILILLGLILVIGTVFGFLSEGTLSVSLSKFTIVYILTVIVFNLLLTLLTAGRIYWIARKNKSILGREIGSQYYFAIAVVAESGLIYNLANILVLSLVSTKLVVMAAVLSIRIVGIMPILVIVQITLGQTTNPENSATAHQTVPIIFDTIVSSNPEAEVNTHRPSVISNRFFVNESARNDIILEQRTEEI